MIIVEGPDGAGKTTLLANLLDQFPGIEQHDKASTSTGGPVPEVELWTEADISSWVVQPLSFYDRHPMFSEVVYSTIIRENPNDWFGSPRAQELGLEMVRRGLFVFCLPSFETVQRNIEAEDQLDGVKDKINELYELYRDWARTMSKDLSSKIFIYDYERPGDYEDLVKVISAHEVKWNRHNRGIV